MTLPYQGRREDVRLVTGRGRYIADRNLPGQTFGAFLRADRPHAEIVAIDTSAALAMPGVVALLLAAFAWRNPVIRGVKTLPSPEPDDMAALGAEAELPEHARPPALSS